MNLKHLCIPFVLAAVLMVGCDKPSSTGTGSGGQPATAKPADVAAEKAAAEKAAAEKVAADKLAAEKVAEKAAADKLAADKAAAEKLAADKIAAEKAVAEKAAADAKAQGGKLLDQFKTAVTSGNWTDADALIKQLDGMRDKMPAELQSQYDSLKKLYNDNKAKLPAIPGLGG
jgi:hypothetical protein